MVIERGSIFWCDLDPIIGHKQGKTRPVVVVSSNSYNATNSPLVAIVPLTKSPPKTPLHLRFSPAQTGIDQEATALVDHTRFLDRSRLKPAAIGRLSPDALALLDRHLARILAL